MKSIRSHVRKDAEEGFTLIELMVVVLILGILMAIAIPTFLSLTNNAKKNAAQSDLTVAITDAAVYYTANGTFGTNPIVLIQSLIAADANINWALYGRGLRIAGPVSPISPLQPAAALSAITFANSVDGAVPIRDKKVPQVPIGGASAATKEVLVSYVNANVIRLGVLDKTGKYYWAQDNAGTIRYAKPLTKPNVPAKRAYGLTSLP